MTFRLIALRGGDRWQHTTKGGQTLSLGVGEAVDVEVTAKGKCKDPGLQAMVEGGWAVLEADRPAPAA
jgi:hypothetical protein